MANENIQELKFQVGEAWKGVYSSSTAYGLANVVQDATGLSIYRSLKSGNVGHPVSDRTWWFCIIDMSSIKSESDRITALNQSIAQDEALRVAAEELRQQHETERIAAETQRNEAEQARVNAEQERVGAESARATAEQQRITAEQERVSAESARVQAEQARVLAETLRANAEDQRAANEQNRVAAEQQRIERAEQDHQRAESDHAAYIDSLGAFDVSSYHATDGVLAKYADLTAALGTNGANIPDDLRKGGMSVKFVQSSDNKYIRYNLIADEFTTDTTQWAIDDVGVYVENPEFVYVKTDSEGKILLAIKRDGTIFYGAGVPQQVIDYIEEKIADLSLDEYEDIVAFLDDLEKGDKTLQTLLDEKVVKEEGKSLIDAEFSASQSTINSSEWIEVKTDNEGKLLEGRKADGTKIENCDVEYPNGIPREIKKYIDSDRKKIKCLFIGNSVCQDHVAYLPWLLKYVYPEVDFEIYLAYRASLTIKGYVLHVITGEVPLGIFSVAKNTASWTNYMESEDNPIYFDEMFSFAKFDIITFEGFFNSHSEDIDYFKTFIDYIKTKQPDHSFKVGYLLHQTYREYVYNDIIQSVIPAMETVPISIVFPCGVVTELVKGLIPQSMLTNDEKHNQQGLPCIMGAYTIMGLIAEYLGLSERIVNNTLRITDSIEDSLNIPGPNGTLQVGTEEQWKICQDAAVKAINYAKHLMVSYYTTRIDNPEYLSVETDKDGRVLSGIKHNGEHYIPMLKSETTDRQQESINDITNLLPLISGGIDNIKLSRNDAVCKLLTSSYYDKNIGGREIELSPMISLIDDDAIDNKIPSSRDLEEEPDTKAGGYFSLLLPLFLSLSDKYGKKLTFGVAAEGHRVGLTTFCQSSDTYTELNENGRLLNKLVEHGHEILNHSMTAQLPSRTYGVESINSELASTILSNGHYQGPLSFQNTIVLDKSTGKWYEVNSDNTAWVERIPLKKYAMPFYRDYNTGEWFLNRDFDFDYSWGEWARRANELGLRHTDLIVHNGSTTHPFTIANARKYARASFHTSGTHNLPPTRAAIQRQNTITGDTNAKDNSFAATLRNAVNYCYNKKTWMVLMTHAYMNEYRNFYISSVTYPERDDNYNQEWVQPLKRAEVISMDENNYWVNPPARLNISRWSEWVPALGTQLRVLYDTLDYALSLGIPIVSPSKGLSIYGNILQLGIDKNGQSYSYNVDESYLEDIEKSYLTIGADGCIRVYSKN